MFNKIAYLIIIISTLVLVAVIPVLLLAILFVEIHAPVVGLLLSIGFAPGIIIVFIMLIHELISCVRGEFKDLD